MISGSLIENYDHLPKDVYFGNYREAARNNLQLQHKNSTGYMVGITMLLEDGGLLGSYTRQNHALFEGLNH
ncbi:hypothetical protein CUMW_254780, partial [Citrus unshiu]